MIKIWSMKAKEAAAEKKKPKTSAAQIRVQKGKNGIIMTLHYLMTLQHPMARSKAWSS